MVSKMFLADWRKMEAEGLKPSPSDAIRLNALAVRVKFATRPLASAHLPRIVFLDGFTLREPTVAHMLWIERVREYMDLGNAVNYRAVHAFALSRPVDALPNPNRHAWTIWRIFAFAKRRAFRLTDAMLVDAIDYALYGADWKVGEYAPPRKPDADGSIPDGEWSPAVGVLLRARARRLPITLDEAKGMTPSELEAVVRNAEIEDCDYDDHAKNDALGDYFNALDEVRSRFRREKGGQV